MIGYNNSDQATNFFLQEFKGRVAGVKVKPVDTTGAGDAFVSGLLESLASDTNMFKVQFVLELVEEMIQRPFPHSPV